MISRRFAIAVTVSGACCAASAFAQSSPGILGVVAAAVQPQLVSEIIFKVPRQPSNVAFAGADKRTLHITARQGLYRLNLLSQGPDRSGK